jgi:hypothetical protein
MLCDQDLKANLHNQAITLKTPGRPGSMSEMAIYRQLTQAISA